MAFTYGSVTKCKVGNGTTRSEYECRFGYEVQSQSIANNTSSVKLRLQVRSISSSYKTYGYNQTSTIDGTKLSAASFDMRSTNTWQTFGERTITVTHSSDGKYSASKTGSFTTTASSGYSLKSGSASVTVAPATIPRYANFTQHYVSRVSTSSITVYWNADAECDWLQYSVNGGLWIDTAGSPEYTIYGLAENSTYNIRTRVRRKDSQLWTESGTITGTTLAKTYPSISVASKTETSITVNSSCNVEVSSTRYRIKLNNENYGNWQTSNVFGGLIANANYTIEVEKVGQASGEYGYATVPVTTYNYPHCISAPDFKIGNNVKLEFYNPLNRTVRIQMWSYVYQGFVSDLITITGTTYTGFSDVKDRLYESIPNAPESQYTIDVWYGDVKSTKWDGGKYSINGNENPTFSNFTYEDTNEITKALTDNPSILVSGYSNLKVKIPVANKAYSNYYSPIDKYRLNVGNMSSVEVPYKSDAQVELTINKVNSPSITVTAIDGRSYTAQVPKKATFKAYFKPIIKSMVATRSDSGAGNQVTLQFSGEWWNDNFGKVDNTIKTIEYYYKKTTDNTWTKGNIAITADIKDNNFSGSAIIEGPSINNGFDVSTAYNIKMTIQDELAVSTEYQVTLGSGTPGIALCNNKVAIGQKYDEELGGTLQVDGYDVSNKFKQYLPLIGGTLKGNINLGHNLGIYWKEDGFGDKFKIVSNFSGPNDDNKLKIMGAVGDAETDPELYDLMTISGKSGNVWIKGSLGVCGTFDIDNSIICRGSYAFQNGCDITTNSWNDLAIKALSWVYIDAGNSSFALRSDGLIDTPKGFVQCKPVVAYSNEAGTTGTVSLSVDVGNYNHIRITYKNSDEQYGSTTISGITNANCTTYGTIVRSTASGGTMLINGALFNVSGTTITISRNIQLNAVYDGSNSKDIANTLAITKVELWN